jgi:D-aminopeptidase
VFFMQEVVVAQRITELRVQVAMGVEVQVVRLAQAQMLQHLPAAAEVVADILRYKAAMVDQAKLLFAIQEQWPELLEEQSPYPAAM